MSIARHVLRHVLTMGAVLSMGLGAASAAPTLLVDGTTHALTGATGVVVNGQTYNVSFVDGSCSGLFGGCDANSDFVFHSRAEANAASRALLDQVLVDGNLGAFDSMPGLLNGCTSSRCAVFTAYGLKRSKVQVAAALNGVRNRSDRISGSQAAARADTSRNASRTYAVWTLQVAATGGNGPTPDDDVTPLVVTTDIEPLDDVEDDPLGPTDDAPETFVRIGTDAPPQPDAPGAPGAPRAPGDGNVPEPGVLALLALAVPLMGMTRRRAKARVVAATA